MRVRSGLMPSPVLFVASALLAVSTAALAQTKTFADPAVPVALVPSYFYSQIYALNQDRTISQYATENIQNAGYTCTAAPGLAAQTAGSPHTLASDGVLYEIGQRAGSLSYAVVGITNPNYNGCTYSTPVTIPANPTAIPGVATDPRHHRLVVLTTDGGNTSDKITGFDTSTFYFSYTAPLYLGQASLDQGAQYTSVVTDFDGLYGVTAITELRTATSPGNLWIYDPNTSVAMKVLAPDGSALPAVNSFVIHNPYDVGGGLLVLANQDGLTAANQSSPPLDTNPFTIIDLGQLHALIAAQPAGTTSVTLPFMTKIGSSLGYYAMLGAAYNPINHLLYAVVGGGTSTGNVYRSVVSYDATQPGTPNETVVADVSSIPIVPPAYPQVTLSAASGTMQFLLSNPNAVYTVGITAGATNTATLLSSSSFPNDHAFQPTAMAVHAIVGDTYIASASGNLDTLTLTTGAKNQALLDLTGPLVKSTVGLDTSLGVYGYFFETSDTSLSSTSITITATPITAGGSPYTFAVVSSTVARSGGTSVSGTFPRAGLYSVVASFPGDSFFAPAVSSPVYVSVAQAPFETQTSLTATATNSTSGTALVTVTGTNYTPAGTITITDVTNAKTIGTYTLSGVGIATPISIPITLAANTTTVTASYSGDSYNQASTSPAVAVALNLKSTLSITGPSTGAKGTTAPFTIALTSASTIAPTGTITVSGTIQGSTTVYPLHPIDAGAAFAAGGATLNFNAAADGLTTITASYPGDSNYLPATASAVINVAGSPSTLTLTPILPATTATPFNVSIALNSSDHSIPTGNIDLTTQLAGGPAVDQGTGPAAAAVQTGGTLIGVGVNAPGTYTLKATYPGDINFAPVTGTATVVVTGVSQLRFYPTSLSFITNDGTVSQPQTVTLTNGGTSTITLSTIQTGGQGFNETSNCGTTLAAGANCTVTITFTATTPGIFTSSLNVSVAGFGVQTVGLTGTAVGMLASVSPVGILFNSQMVGTTSVTPTTITLTNAGTLPLAVLNLTSNDTADFQVYDMNCFAQSPIAVGASCQVVVTFHPSAVGSRSGVVQFTTSDTVTPQSIGVAGQGLGPGQCLDSDGDGLCDDWEMHGLYVHVAGKNDVFIDLPSMGADPMHKDIFLHVDYMVTDPRLAGSHSHKPNTDATAALQKLFLTVPVINPDTTPGIHLHIDCGTDCIMNPVTGALWGSASQATSYLETTPLDPVSAQPTFNWSTFDTFSSTFTTTGRSLVFHHVLFGHDLWSTPGYVGLSRNAADETTFRKGASDFIVALGSSPIKMGGSMGEQESVMFHELGHNLSLEHGGRDSFSYKPNQLSIMNYSFLYSGMTIDGKNGKLDYSEFALPLMIEPALNEVTGIGADPKVYLPTDTTSPTLDHYGTQWFCSGDDPTKVAPHKTNTPNSNVNWDCDSGGVISSRVSTDVNGNGAKDVYASVQEWPLLVFGGGAIAGNAAGITIPMQTSFDEIDGDRASLNVPAYGVAISGMSTLLSPPGSTTSLHFVVKNTGSTADSYNLASSSALGWSKVAPVPAVLNLAPGASAEVTLSYTVPVGTATGTKEKVTLAAASQNDTYIMDSAQVYISADPSPLPLSISASSVNFAVQATGGTSGTRAVAITNTGTLALALTFAATTEFAQTNTCGASLAAGASCSVSLSFTPAAAGVRNGTLTISSAGLSAPMTVALRGNAVVVNNNPRPTITLTITPAATSTGQTVTIAANIARTAGSPVPTGVVTFTDGTTVFGTVPADASGNATLATSTLAAGTYNLYATYPGDAAYNVGASPVQQFTIATAVATTASVSSSAITAAPGASIVFTATIAGGSGTSQPTGSVRFFDGTTLLGTGTLNASAQATYTTTALAIGTHAITVSYAGDNVFGASSSAAIQEVVQLNATTTTLAVSGTTVVTGTAVNLTATVSSSAGVVGGSVTFIDGTTVLNTATLNAGGVATYSTATLALGAHSLTAKYGGAATFAQSVSTAMAVTVVAPPDYSVAPTPASLTIVHGSTGTANFAVTPLNSYAGTVTFSCGTLPADASCKFSPAQLVFTATAQTAQTATLTIGTTQGVSMLTPGFGSSKAPGIVLALAMWLPLGWFARRRSRRQRLYLAAMLVGLSGLTALSGCGNGNFSPQTTPAGTYTIPLTITDGTINHSISYTVAVQ